MEQRGTQVVVALEAAQVRGAYVTLAISMVMGKRAMIVLAAYKVTL